MGGKKVFELMLEIGHKSHPLKAKLPNGYTHKWTVFVKGANNTKIEHCIQRVVFQLHDSFPNPHREITEPPFQVKETGYAGFEIPIDIYFKNRDKPNHLVFVLDLCLLTAQPNHQVNSQKVSFYHPNREFEKCLIKTGAQMILSKEKKERSDSPPAKKQKSSSLIPSKDMGKQATQTQFLDVFGAPLVINNNNNNNNNDISTSSSSNNNSSNNHHTTINSSNNHNGSTSNTSKSHKSSSAFNLNQSPPPQVPRKPHKPAQASIAHAHSGSKSSSHHSKSHHKHHHHHHHNHHIKPEPTPVPQQVPSALPAPITPQPTPQLIQQTGLQDPFQTIQDKISSLTDCDRLQKIVDIIEEAGEWYNLTSSKFEFDLKRLDKKTLYRIEKCLNL